MATNVSNVHERAMAIDDPTVGDQWNGADKRPPTSFQMAPEDSSLGLQTHEEIAIKTMERLIDRIRGGQLTTVTISRLPSEDSVPSEERWQLTIDLMAKGGDQNDPLDSQTARCPDRDT